MNATPNERYNRWQGLTIAQLSVAVALLSALSVAGLSTGLSLMQNNEFMACLQARMSFLASQVLFLICATLSLLSVITRTLDFRLTARKVRKDRRPTYDGALTVWRISSKQYGNLTWFLFWLGVIAFIGAGVLLVFSVGSVYGPMLWSSSAA